MRILKLFVLFSVVLLAACGGSGNITGPGPIPTVAPPPETTHILGWQVWHSGTGCNNLPDPACEVLPNADGSYTVHNYAGGAFRGRARFITGCTVVGRYWSDPAGSLLDTSEETPDEDQAVINGGGDAYFMGGMFRYRPANDPRHADPATIHIRTTCGSVHLDGDLVIHQVQ